MTLEKLQWDALLVNSQTKKCEEKDGKEKGRETNFIYLFDTIEKSCLGLIFW